MDISLIAAILLGLIGLVYSADWFVEGASDTARYLHVSPLVIGLIFVGFGTSAPEMLVAATAAWNGAPSLAIGNAVGSNITNLTLILGATALVSPMVVRSRIIRRELPVLFVVCCAAYLLMWDGALTVFDGVILLIGLVIIIGYTYWEARTHTTDAAAKGLLANHTPKVSRKRAMLNMMVGLVVLIVSSKLLVWGASGVARTWGVSELVIGLTIVAIGTSLPELASSFLAARRGQADLAIGNVVGSNLFNTLGVLALPGLLAPTGMAREVLVRDMPFMLVTTVVVWLMALGYKRLGGISRLEGLVLLILFIAYQLTLFHTAH